MSLIEQAQCLQIWITEASRELDQLPRRSQSLDSIAAEQHRSHVQPQEQSRLMTVGLAVEQIGRTKHPPSGDRIMVALIVLLRQPHRDTSSPPPVAIPLEARLGPLEQPKHLVIAPRPAGRVRQTLNIRRNKRILGIGPGQQAIGTLPLSGRERLPTSRQLILAYGAHTVPASRPVGELRRSVRWPRICAGQRSRHARAPQQEPDKTAAAAEACGRKCHGPKPTG